jgi:hypothetical protein
VNLPGSEKAILDPAKTRDYLLSPEHPVGRFKAVFFNALGYTREDASRLDADLLALAASEPATLGQASNHGRKFEVRGVLHGPAGRSAQVVTVWIILAGEEAPRFVTAYPG